MNLLGNALVYEIHGKILWHAAKVIIWPLGGSNSATMMIGVLVKSKPKLFGQNTASINFMPHFSLRSKSR